MRELVLATTPDIVEQWKWMSAFLAAPTKRFNASLVGNVRRAIDIAEGQALDATALQALVKEAIAHTAAKWTTPEAKPEAKAKPPLPANAK